MINHGMEGIYGTTNGGNLNYGTTGDIKLEEQTTNVQREKLSFHQVCNFWINSLTTYQIEFLFSLPFN